MSPQVDGGRYPIKRTIGENVHVEADIFADGHDVLTAVLRVRPPSGDNWQEIPLAPLGNDRWAAEFPIEHVGEYRYSLLAWVDHARTWRRDLQKKAEAGQDVEIDLQTGALLVRRTLDRISVADRPTVEAWLQSLDASTGASLSDRVARALDDEIWPILLRSPDRTHATLSPQEWRVMAEPVRARYGAWYELFPRSCRSDGSRHGTFADVEAELPRVASMGFDVVYLPPIHPIGEAYRKGRNNAPTAQPGEPGSPWAIGGKAGGHTAIHPELGTEQDFSRLVHRAQELGIDLALDLAFQCSPDHPYVREHPEWFKARADGSIQYAENPPKKYQDIYPFDFETLAWESLWRELKSVIEHWIDRGITVFRVDNPHTKAFPFWEWVITELKRDHPELIFLSEAFTRPKVMYNLAKLGFTQSYNYFPWRNTRDELRTYLTELTRTPVKEFFRPNLWPNTPDILPTALQVGGRAVFVTRFILAATLGASYGIYGPAYELMDHAPLAPGKEEYLNSEKYEIRAWNLNAPGSLEPLIRDTNRIRRENPALHSNDLLAFHDTDNEQMLVYSKRTPDRENIILVAVNLDPHHIQRTTTTLDLAELGIEPATTFQVHDLLTGARYLWRGARNLIELDPKTAPAAIYRLKRRVQSERDFDYFL